MSDAHGRDVEALLLRQIIRAELAGDDQLTAELHELATVPDDVLIAATNAVLQNILDHINAVETGSDGARFRTRCDEARVRSLTTLGPTSLTTGVFGFLCLNAELLRRRFDPPAFVNQEDSDEYCRGLFDDGSIRPAIYAIYAPKAAGEQAQRAEASGAAVREWRKLDPSTLRYFKAGTTSAILLAEEADASGAGSRKRLVVKCVLFPWNKIPAVANATDGYTLTYGSADLHHVVRPEASTDRWVIMDFEPGPTLHEALAERAARPDWQLPGTRIRFARKVANALMDALASLAKGPTDDEGAYPAIQHLDLSPNNVMIATVRNEYGDDVITAKLIDLGVNHLYSRQIGIAEHDDSIYVAPEVKNRGPRSPTADVYSIGMILIEILAGRLQRDGRVPDAIYEMSPILGRALEDLIEEDPRRRLLLLPDRDRFTYPALWTMLNDVFLAVADEPAASRSKWKRTYTRYAPASRELSTQAKKWWFRRRTDPSTTYLFFFSLIATVSWVVVFALTATAWIRDNAAAVPSTLIAPSAAAVITFAQGLMAAKFYQTVLARLTARRVPGLLATLTEVAMRSMTIVALPTLFLALLWKPWLWAWTCAAGAAAVAFTHLLTMVLARRLFTAGRANGLSTVPPPESEIPRGYEQWWWTMLLYAVVIGIIAWGLGSGWLHDESAYVFGLMIINIGIHYISKCAIAGFAIRGGLARAFVVGERLALLRRSTGAPIANWPPRFFHRRGSV